MKSALELNAAGATDVGKEREHNEDSLVVDSKSKLFAVADGMGGHMLGEVASQATLDELVSKIQNHAVSTPGPSKQDEFYNIVSDAIVACNELLLDKNRGNGGAVGEGMGTTLVGAYFLRDNRQVVVFNVGDSRLYRFRDGTLKQLTHDHTMYQQWHDAGKNGVAPARNILVNAVGLVENITPDISLENVSDGDMFLICSDGLSNLIDSDSIQDFLNNNQHLSPDAVCKELICTANIVGGHDNITVVTIKVNNASSTVDKTDVPEQTMPHNLL